MSERASRTILECPVCFEAYGQDTNVPLIGTCGHTICSLCWERLIPSTCPICRTAHSFIVRRQNYTTIELLTALADLQKTVKSKATSPEDGCLHCRCVLYDAEAFICKQCVDVNDDNDEAVLTALKKARICEDCGRSAGKHGHELTKYTDFVLEESAKRLDKQLKDALPESAMDAMMKALDDEMALVKKNFAVLKERINNVSCTRSQLQQLGVEEARRIATDSKNCARNANTAYNEGKTALNGVNRALRTAADLVDKFKATESLEAERENAVRGRAPVVVPSSIAEAPRSSLPRVSTIVPRTLPIRVGTIATGRPRISLMSTTQPSSSRTTAAPGTSRLPTTQRLRTRNPSAVSTNN